MKIALYLLLHEGESLYPRKVYISFSKRIVEVTDGILIDVWVQNILLISVKNDSSGNSDYSSCISMGESLKVFSHPTLNSNSGLGDLKRIGECQLSKAP